MSRRTELENLNPVKLYDLMLEYNIPVCKREDAINRILEIEQTKKAPKKAANTKLKTMRIMSGLSQSALAEKANLNKRTLQAYEQGYKPFDNTGIDTILRVALALNCKIEDILENPDYLELINKYNVMINDLN